MKDIPLLPLTLAVWLSTGGAVILLSQLYTMAQEGTMFFEMTALWAASVVLLRNAMLSNGDVKVADGSNSVAQSLHFAKSELVHETELSSVGLTTYYLTPEADATLDEGQSGPQKSNKASQSAAPAKNGYLSSNLRRRRAAMSNFTSDLRIVIVPT
ncbi:hypothetical protein KEM54_000950 [Ascosphaera aggregata]|nr:hypothetical protein KEM54_000950 [Ascosphaera aggregata]